MATLGKHLRTVAGGLVAYHCPGCGERHMINVDPENGRPCWSLSNAETSPTVTPSVLSNADRSNPAMPRCHHFIRAGKIEYLSDCTHALAGKTVPMVELDKVE